PERAKQLTDVELADILRRLQALEAGVKAEPEPKAEPIEKAVPRIEQPNEIEVEEVVPRIEQPNEIELEEVVPRIGQPNEVEAEEVVPWIAQPNEVEVRALIPKVEQPNEVEVKKVAAKVEQPKEVNEISDVNKIAQPVPKVGLYEPEPLANGEDIIQLDLPEKLTMIEFLDFMGENLQLDYLYNPAEVKGDVTLRLRGQLRGPIKVKNLYPLLQSVLQFNDFVMVRDRNLVTIRKKASADILNPPLVRLEGDEIETGDVVIQRVFELKHIDTGSGQNLLKGLQLGIKVTPIQQTGTLIVTEYAHRMARIQELLEMIDKPGEPKQFKLRELKFTMAESLTPKIKTLAEQLGTISVTVAAPAAAPQKAPPRGRKAPPKRGAPAPPKPTAKPTVYLEADKRTNRILMIGLKEQLAVVDELITVLDVEQKDLRSMRLYQIENVDAEEVMAKLSELGIISGAGAAGRTAPRSGRLTGAAAKAGAKPPPAARARARTGTGEEAAPLVEEPQVVIIETVNSLLVNATAEQHVQIATIIGYVDNEPEATDIPYVIYPLENQDPEELAGVLNQLVQETTTKQDKAGKVEKTIRQRTEEEIIIISDPKTYSLIVYASKRNQQWIKALIEQLDAYRPQVLLDVMLVEVSKTDNFELTLNWLQSFPDLTGSSFDLTKVIMPPGATGSGRDRFIDFDSGGNAFYADKHINFLLNTMQTKDFGRILARPKLLVNDNETGTIKTSEDKPIVSVETKVIPGTSAQASTAAPSVKIDTYSAGITLEIEPHISKGDQLRLTITLTRTDFRLNNPYSLSAGGEAITGPTPPDLLTSDITTVVTVPDNHTIILGGLERLNQGKGGTKIPILGDLPIVGGLFRNTKNTDLQSRLYVFVKAHILRPGQKLAGVSDIELVSAKNRATFEKYEEEMQKYEDWPGIKPKPMDPVRVLETD
ncbi:MAG: secretin N-terminal domain-containing protein, partial [Planctomycetota bacterium]